MSDARIDQAIARIDAALTRIAAARAAAPSDIDTPGEGGAADFDTLANRHERLRNEVAAAIGDIDALIAALEG